MIEAAVRADIAWYRSADVQLENTAYVNRPSSNRRAPVARCGAASTTWTRTDQDTCFFSGRLPIDESPGERGQYDIMDIEPECR